MVLVLSGRVGLRRYDALSESSLLAVLVRRDFEAFPVERREFVNLGFKVLADVSSSSEDDPTLDK